MNEKSLSDIREKKLILRVTGMIVIGVLGVIALIGLFFGNSALIGMGVFIFVTLVIILFIILSSSAW